MAAATYDITIEQGATFLMNVLWKDSAAVPIDLTNYTARMQVRYKYNSADALLDMSTTDGSIVLGGVAGTIAVTGAAADTAAIDVKTGVYDLEMTDTVTGIVTRLLEGCATITPEVTRA